MDPRGVIDRLKRRLLPSSCGEWVLAVLLLVLVACVWAYSTRDDLYKTYLGLQPLKEGVSPAVEAFVERAAEGAKSIGRFHDAPIMHPPRAFRILCRQRS